MNLDLDEAMMRIPAEVWNEASAEVRRTIELYATRAVVRTSEAVLVTVAKYRLDEIEALLKP